MSDDHCLNEVDPTIKTVRQWGYREDVYFIEQDEDLILHDVRYAPILMELTADECCPKKSYALSILAYFSQLALLSRRTDEVTVIAQQIASSPYRDDEKLADWLSYFDRLRELLQNPSPLNPAQMETVARDLLVGPTCQREFASTKKIVDGYHEFTCFTQSYRGFLYIDPQTGRWQASQHVPLTEIS